MGEPEHIFDTRLDVRRMRVLREVADQGSITGAADALNFSPSAVSQQIRVLEQEADMPLLNRGSRTTLLTSAGRALLDHTDFILERLDQAEEDIRAIAELRGGRLRLATFRSAGETIMAEAITYFHNRYPDVELSLLAGEPENYLADVKRNAIDIGLTFEYELTSLVAEDSIERVLIATEPMVLVLPVHHVATTRRKVALAALADDDWIVAPHRSAARPCTERVCAAAGFSPRVRLEADDYHVVQSLVAAGLGVSLLPILAVRNPHPGVVVRPVAVDAPTRRLYAAHRPGGERAPAVAAMLSVLRDLGGSL